MRALLVLALASVISAPQKKIGLLPQSGHTGAITALAFHPGGRLVASGATDQTILVWDLFSGKIVRRFRGHFAPIKSLVFDVDGTKLYSLDEAASYSGWELAGGGELFSQRISGARGLGVGPNGLFVAADDKAWRVYEGASGKRRIEAWLEKPARTVFSADGRYAATLGAGGKRVVLDLETSEQYTLPALGGGGEEMAFSPDGKWLAVARENAPVALWSFEASSFVDGPISGQLVAFAKDGTAMFSASGRQLLRAAPAGWKLKNWAAPLEHVDRIEAITVSPDGKIVAVAGKGGVSLFDATSGERTLVNGVEIPLESVALDPQGTLLVQRIQAAPPKSDLRVWSLSEMRPVRMVRSIRGWFFAESGALYAQDGNQLTVLEAGAKSAPRGIELPQVCDCAALVGGPGDSFVCIPPAGVLTIFSKDGKLLFGGVGGAGPITTHALSPDRAFLALGRAASKSIEVIDLAAGRSIAVIPAAGSLERLLFSDDGKQVFACCTANETMEVFAKTGGAALGRAAGVGRPIAAIGPNVLTWNPRTTRVGLLDRALAPISGFAAALEWGPEPVATGAGATRDGKRIALGRKNGEVLVLSADGASLAVHERMRLHSADVVSLTFASGGKFLSTSSTDGSTAVYEVASKKKLWLLARGADWLVYSSDGWFDASRRGGELAAMVQGERGFAVDQLALRYNRPDLLIETFGGAPELMAHFRAQSEKRLRKAGLALGSPASDGVALPSARILSTKKRAASLELEVELEDPALPLASYNVFVNDVPVWGQLGKKVPAVKKHKTKTKVELSPGRNKIEVAAYNVAGTESFRALTQARRDDAPRGRLYYLGFGVSKYRDPSLDLAFAHKDARDLGAQLQALGGAFDSVEVKTFVDHEVTVAAIKSAKKFLAKAKPEDTFVLFVAGHGAHAGNAEATYYFLTHEADVSKLEKTAAPFELIEDLLQDIGPRKKLFLLDTCESGELDRDEAPRLAMRAEKDGNRARGLKRAQAPAAVSAPVAGGIRPHLLDRDRYIYNDLARRSGAIVFSSSRGGELSYERADLENGLFTESLLQALSTPVADVDRDGKVSSTELRAYVTEAVSKSSGDLQHPTVDRDNISLELIFTLPR